MNSLSFLLATVMLPHVVDAPTPLSYLTGHGTKAAPVVALTWGLIVISTMVTFIVAGLVVWGIARRGVPYAGGMTRVPVTPGPRGGLWVITAVSISAVVLLGSLVWSVIVLANVDGSHLSPAMTIDVTGQQWWWKATYLNNDPARQLTTANEIHIPVGKPIRVRLMSPDVIHSFWVPALSGKEELIPGHTNVTWLEADHPGVYVGQCTEFCGDQHAHMGFLIVAQSPADFDKWLNAQLQPALAPQGKEALQDEKEFVFHCGTCHTVRGTGAGGVVAPDLTHLMSRRMLAADTLTNTPANLIGWISDPQAMKPGTKMPVLYLSGDELNDIQSYVRTLK
ncbi:MAG TPA: cytochrome c oxidase subunit II [Methylovirgula sp.]